MTENDLKKEEKMFASVREQEQIDFPKKWSIFFKIIDKSKTLSYISETNEN